jgi:hypothetical protein
VAGIQTEGREVCSPLSKSMELYFSLFGSSCFIDCGLAIVAKSVGSSTLGRRYGRWRFAGTFNDSVFGSLGAGQLVASNNVVASFFGGPASSIVLGPPSSFWRRRNSKQSTFRLMWTKTPRSICKGLCCFFFFCQVLLCKGLVVMFLCF